MIGIARWACMLPALALVTVAAAGAQTPGVANKPLSVILQMVEAKGTRTVFSAENHRGLWEVVSCERRQMVCREDAIDGVSGAVRRSERELVLDLRPPATAKPASGIARGIEAAGLGDIRELEWDTRAWEARVRNANGRAELQVDPMTGAVRRCEGPGCRR